MHHLQAYTLYCIKVLNMVNASQCQERLEISHLNIGKNDIAVCISHHIPQGLYKMLKNTTKSETHYADECVAFLHTVFHPIGYTVQYTKLTPLATYILISSSSDMQVIISQGFYAILNQYDSCQY